MGFGPSPWLANRSDVLTFMDLVQAFAEEGRSPGMTWGGATYDFYLGLFRAYTPLGAAGAVALCLDGFCLAGGPLPYNTPWGKTAAGWGTYVRPDARGKGLSRQLRQLVIDRLRKLGFKAIIGQVDSNNAAGQASLDSLGWTILGNQGVYLIQ